LLYFEDIAIFFAENSRRSRTSAEIKVCV